MRAQKIAIFLVYGFLLLASGAFLFGCGDDSASTAPQGPQPVAGPLGQAAVGAWQADTILQVTTLMGVVSSAIVIDDTLRADSTFSAAVYIHKVIGAIFDGRSVQGAIHTRTGHWTTLGDSILVLNTSSCQQADTASIMGIQLPFSIDAMTANPLKAVPCGAPDTVRTRPQTDGHWRVPMNVNPPGVATGSWVLDFVRQP